MKLAKKGMGIGFSFIGMFFTLIGCLFAILFEIPGLFALVIVGFVFLALGVSFLRSTRDISIFDLPNKLRPQIHQCGKCGRVVPWDALLCPYCGQALSAPAPGVFCGTNQGMVQPAGFNPAPSSGATYRNPATSFPNVPAQSVKSMNCKTCGTKIDTGMKYCQYCGADQSNN